MNCEQWFSLINARMDGELPPEEHHRLTVHLDECADCRIAADEFEKGDRELARLFSHRQNSAAKVAERVLEAWSEESTTSSVSVTPHQWKLPLAVAAGFALAFLLFEAQWSTSDVSDSGPQIRAMVSDWQEGDLPKTTELDLRALGSAAVVPLLEVVNNWVGDADAPKRLAAARMIGDLADTTQIPIMIALLGDRSSEIRTLSNTTLVRLTGGNRFDAVQTEDGAPSQAGSCSNPHAEWQAWWEKNKDRFEQSSD